MMSLLRKHLPAAVLGAATFGLFAFISQRPAADRRTEEYALVSVLQVGKKNFVSVTVGSQTTAEREFEAEKNTKRYDMAPVLAELEKLNAQGYELVNGSSAASGQAGYPFYSFILKRKLN